MRKFITIIFTICIIVLFININQSLALNQFKSFQMAKYKYKIDDDENKKDEATKFADAKENLLKQVVDKLYVVEDELLEKPTELKTEMILPGFGVAPLEQFGTLPEDFPKPEYAINLVTLEGIFMESVTGLTPEEINSIYKCEATIVDGRYTDIYDKNQWKVYFKAKCSMEYIGDEYILTVEATDIAKTPSELSINPEDIVQPEHEEEDPSLIDSAKNLDEMFNDFSNDPLRDTRKMALECIKNTF